ncbi:DsbA family protein [Photobacterium minamisatsumaniensis]|uniref:DsbA family protein n=1 Tax=Photobacterium minamisatsumaniensis TaxID=2910233 RepID=UPI003D0F62A1
MSAAKIKLYYVYDPMCSWCWGYKPTWDKIREALSDHVEVVYVLGGLAPDSDTPMPEAMQVQIASYWKKIEQYLGTPFNHDFWTKNTPRRSTYPSCRAIIAARSQGAELIMLEAIQKAYYLEAKNPSHDAILISLAEDLGLDSAMFKAEFLSNRTQDLLLEELAFARSIGGNSFPSLIVEKGHRYIEVPINYESADATLAQLNTYL